MHLDQAASLLAMHCAVRGQTPADYLVMVPLENDLLGEVTSRASKLLEATRDAGPAVRLSRREQQVLAGVLQSLRNKEIASRLCISERTVKFYVSALLSKFQVRSRMALSEAARLLLRHESLPGGAPLEFRPAEETARNAEARPGADHAASRPGTSAPLTKSLAVRIWRGKLATT